jgi:outer membrane protein OmpA-like peptidoglycan-associated protein
MNTKNVSKLGITAAAVSVGLCAWSATTMAQTRIGRAGDRICLTSSPANLGAPIRTAGRVEMAVRPGTDAQKQKVERVVFSEMMFANNSDRLSDVGVGRSYLVAQKLKRGTNIRVVVQGHRIGGSSTQNHELCLQRAEAVKQELENFGIAESRMSAVRFGRAAASFKADWARAVHERAEFEIEAEDRGTSSNKSPEPVDQTTL